MKRWRHVGRRVSHTNDTIRTNVLDIQLINLAVVFNVISSVSGNVVRVGLDAAEIVVSGVGLTVLATARTLSRLRVGLDVSLSTTLVVREDSMTLYGFDDGDERDVFQVLLSVSGIGPRLALAVLSVHAPEVLRRAVADEDIAALTKVPGIGKKGAARMLIELADRIGPPSDTTAAQKPAAAAKTSGHDDVVQALIGLGWNTKQAEAAVESVADPTVTSADLLKYALQELGKSS